MDDTYIQPFVVALQKVFDVMIDVPFELGTPEMKNPPLASHGISGIMGLSGAIKGCVVLTLSTELAMHLSSVLLEEEVAEVNRDCTDAVSELVNMVTGNAVSEFPEDDVQTSIPSVLVGALECHYHSEVPVTCIPAKAAGQDLMVYVGFDYDCSTQHQ